MFKFLFLPPDLGAGTGKLAQVLAELIPPERIIAVEPSAAMRETFHEMCMCVSVYLLCGCL